MTEPSSHRASDTTPGPDAPDPRAHYLSRGAAARAEAETLEGKVLRTSRLRTVAFLGAAAPLLLLETTSRSHWPALLALAALAASAFLAFVLRHRRQRRALARARLRETLAAEGLARLDRDWSALPPPPLDEAPADHPSATDLDLVGPASLAHLVGRVETAPGRALLRRLLLDPLAPLPSSGEDLLADPRSGGGVPAGRPDPGWSETVAARQAALRSLALERGFREEIEILGREGRRGEGREGESRRESLVFLEWSRNPGLLDVDRRSLLLARFLGIFTPAALVASILGWAPGLFPLIGAVVALGLNHRMAARIHARFAAAEAGEGMLRRWSGILAHAESLETQDPVLRELVRSVRRPEPGASGALRSLVRITDLAAIRHSSMAHFFLVALFAYDLHVLDRLERWRHRHGDAVEGWVRALGMLEVLSALGGLTHDHPHWSFPEFEGNPAAGIQARSLGHPLLHPARCVPNDLTLPGPGRLLLVTGSNMAGKTTLLRALGVNQVLALAGAPVAAADLRTRIVLPWSAMRVRDSLAEGVSYFLAELHRLRRVVTAAEREPVLYLLDEILQGTNSAERRTAARIVLHRLLETGSVGAITTHDLTLADTGSLRTRSVDVHFREEVREVDGVRGLDFDYRLRPGPATSRNALLLLEMVGLGSGESHAGDAVDGEDSRTLPDPGDGGNVRATDRT